MDYIAPSYDIWQLGCLLFEAATGGKAFNANLRKLHLEYRKSDHGYNDQHYILACMVRVLGLFPRGVSEISAQYSKVHHSTSQYSTVQHSATSTRGTERAGEGWRGSQGQEERAREGGRQRASEASIGR